MKNAVILIPSYEPDNLLINTIKELKENDFSIVVINDGSIKDYDDIFNQISNDVSYFRYENNMGKGYALKYGFNKIKECFPNIKYVITVDGDGQHSLNDILNVYDTLNKYDEIVFGMRKFDGKVPFRSRLGNEMSKFNRSLLTKQFVNDDQCGLRGFPTRYLDELISIKGNRYEYEMNQIVLFQLKQYEIKEVEIKTIFLDENSRSHFSPIKDTLRIQYRILSHSYFALLSLGLGIFFSIFFFDIGLPLWGSISLGYLISFIIHFVLSIFLYPSKNILKRLIINLSFTLVKYGASIALLYFFIIFLHQPHQFFISLILILISLINIPLSYIYSRLAK